MASSDPYGTDVILEWLRGLAPHAHLTWGDYHLAPEGYHSSWIDVQVAGAQDLGLAWLWTVDYPSDEPATPDQIYLEPDAQIWWPREAFESGEHDRYAITGVNESPNETDAQRLGEGAVAHPAWSSTAVNAALREWCAVHAGRGDLTFAYDPHLLDAEVDELAELADAALSGLEPTYEIAPGVVATAQALDFLLADPERAAHIIEGVTHIAREPGEPG